VPDPQKQLGSVEVFCSYSHKDEQYRREFETHVSLMKRQNFIQIWQDRKILAGDDWAGDIGSHLNSADMVTLFISADFIASDYCYEKEMTRAMERHKAEKIPVVPIVVRQCDWHDAPFGKLQALPTDGKPVKSWPDQDEAWLDVAIGLKLTVKSILENRKQRLQSEAENTANRLEMLSVSGLTEIFNEQQRKNHEWQIEDPRGPTASSAAD
jgi:hypothetical protein